MRKSELISFEREVADRFEAGEISAPVHLSGGNEDELIEIFLDVRDEDYVFSTWRSHYHALLKGIPREEVMRQILAGRSMFISSPAHNFDSSAIMGGCLPIACGVAEEGARVWCFVGDMCACTGPFHDAGIFASCRNLDIRFIVEDNGLATNTPTMSAWGGTYDHEPSIHHSRYKRTYPHYQSRSGGGRGF